MASVALRTAVHHVRSLVGPGHEAEATDRQLLERFAAFRDEDAFAGLRIMDSLAARKKLEQVGSVALKSMVKSAQSSPTVVVENLNTDRKRGGNRRVAAPPHEPRGE